MRTVFPDCKYSVALERAGIPTLSARCESLCLDLFSNIIEDGNHTLADLLPPNKSTHNRKLKSRRVFNIPVCKTDRYIYIRIAPSAIADDETIDDLIFLMQRVFLLSYYIITFIHLDYYSIVHRTRNSVERL